MLSPTTQKINYFIISNKNKKSSFEPNTYIYLQKVVKQYFKKYSNIDEIVFGFKYF